MRRRREVYLAPSSWKREWNMVSFLAHKEKGWRFPSLVTVLLGVSMGREGTCPEQGLILRVRGWGGPTGATLTPGWGLRVP